MREDSRPEQAAGGKRKKKKKGGALFWIIVVILLGVIIYSGSQVGKILWEYYQGTQQYKEVAETAEIKEKGDDLSVNWRKLMAKYDNVKGWLYSKGTVINYPIVQGEDNSFYLYHMINGEYNGKGSLFLDYQCEQPFRQFLSVIYGHRMKDGSMFHSLIEYRDHAYYEKHPKMLLVTPDESYDVLVFAAVTIPSDSVMYNMWFEDEAALQAYLDWIREHTELVTDVDVTIQDRIVMMSTCTYEFDEARLVVYGKLVKRKQ